jgi:hypothetical protein
MPSVANKSIMLSVIMPNVVMLNVVMLSVFILNVVVPRTPLGLRMMALDRPLTECQDQYS